MKAIDDKWDELTDSQVTIMEEGFKEEWKAELKSHSSEKLKRKQGQDQALLAHSKFTFNREPQCGKTTHATDVVPTGGIPRPIRPVDSN